MNGPPAIVVNSVDGSEMVAKDPRYSREFQMIKQSSSELAEEEGMEIC